MKTIRDLLEEYKQRAETILVERRDRNADMIALENQMADTSELGEGDRLELRALMAEYRRQKVNDYEAGALDPDISRKDSGPRSGEYK